MNEQDETQPIEVNRPYHKFPLEPSEPIRLYPSHRSPEPRRRNWAVWLVCVSILIVLAAIISAALMILPDKASTIGLGDSGVAACKEIVKNYNKPGSTTNDDTPMTKADYDKAVGPFKNSSHSDLKVAGTNFVDTIYNMSKKGEDIDLGSAMVFMNQIQTQYASLQTACANHGVDLPALQIG